MSPEEPIQAAPPRRRKLRQFGLSTFLIAVTVLGVWLGWVFNHARSQARHVAAIRNLGGHVFYDYQCDEETMFPDVNRRSPWPEWLFNLLGPDVFHNVVEVHFTDHAEMGRVRKAYPDLVGLPHVRTVMAFAVVDDELRLLSELPEVETLLLYYSPITDDGLAHLRSMQSLRMVGLDETDTTYAGAMQLEEWLPGCEVSWD